MSLAVFLFPPLRTARASLVSLQLSRACSSEYEGEWNALSTSTPTARPS